MAPVTYRIELTPAANRELRKLPAEARRRVSRRIDGLASEPRPAGVEKLAGADGLYRVRVGDYRVVYTIADEVLIVVVVRIGHRRDVYRLLSSRS